MKQPTTAAAHFHQSAAAKYACPGFLFALLLLPQLLVTPASAVSLPLWHRLFGGGVAAADACAPQQVLSALGSDSSELRLTWRTAGANCLSEVLVQRLSDEQQQSQPPLVAGQANTFSAVGYSYVLSENDMCDDPAASNTFTWHLHRATLKGLVPGAPYRYRIQGGSRQWRFRAPPVLAPDASFTFLGFGDMGDAVHAAAKSPGAASTLLRLRQEVESSSRPAELILHAGDLAYAGGVPEIWDSFIEGLQPFAGRVPYMIGVGNWEYGYTARRGHSQSLTDPSGAAEPYHPSWGNFGPDSRGECGAVAARRFHMPNHYRGRVNNAPFWYGFDYGSVHFTVISTEHALVPGSRQHDWLQQELAGVDRCVTPWLVVMLHRPMYVIYPHKSNREVGEHIRAQIEPLLLQHKVDMTISGHVHSYYRTCAVQDEECVEDDGDSLRTFTVASPQGTSSGSNTTRAGAAAAAVGPSPTSQAGTAAGSAAGLLQQQQQQQRSPRRGIVHFVIGSAGRKLSDVERDQSEWCAETVKRWGYGRFTVRNAHSLLAEYVGSEDGDVYDAVEVRASQASRGAECSSKPQAQAQPAVAVS